MLQSIPGHHTMKSMAAWMLKRFKTLDKHWEPSEGIPPRIGRSDI